MDDVGRRVSEKDYKEDYYELDYSRYEKQDPFSLIRIKRVFSFLEPKKNDIVADIGCGVGTFSLELAPRVESVYAVDFSSDALDNLNRIMNKRNCKNIKLLKNPVEALEIEDSSVDFIVSADLVEHLYEDQFDGFLNECYRILKPNGYMVIYTPNIETHLKKKAQQLYQPVKKIIYGLIKKGSCAQIEKYEYLHVGIKSVDNILYTLKEKRFTVECIKYFENPIPFPLGNLDLVKKNFAKRYLVKCQKQ